jgi:peptidoglycan/LPS O-acetylase OafA/YrhL
MREEGRGTGLRYMPALDGLRALAVLAVLLYHGDVSWAEGGYLGVDAFFVLSGFLITSLLLAEWSGAGRIDLAAFGGRRARRLLPALVLVLAAVAVYAAIVALPNELDQLRHDSFATLGYVANWNQILSDSSYFDQFAAPSALRHTWSLAIEEQFYLVWPLVVLGVLKWRRGSHRALFITCAVLATASTIWMAVLYEPGRDPSRVYYGTDTRAQSLLIGAMLAVLVTHFGGLDARRWRPALHGAALVALGLLLSMWITTDEGDGWQFRGGYALAAVLVTVVIASVTQLEGGGPLGAALSWRPVVLIGLISYGLYLWHWPIYVWLSSNRTGLTGPALLALRLAVTFAAATASYIFVEHPIRRGSLRGWHVRVGAPATAAVLIAAVLFTTTGGVPSVVEDVSASELVAPTPTAPTRTAEPVTPQAEEPPRVLLVGDSMARSLGSGIERVAAREGFQFWDASVPGCGLASDVGERWFAEWRGIDANCLPAWRERWPGQLAAFDPDIVIALFGAQDAFDRRVDGTEIRFDDAEGSLLAQRDLTEALTLLSSTGAQVTLLTTPYYVLGWPQLVEVERSPLNERWIDRYNLLQRAVAARLAETTRDRMKIIDLNRYLAPERTWTDTVAGIKVRSFDRCHLSPEGADFVAAWLVPRLLNV